MVRLPMRCTKGQLSPLESADPHFPPVTPLECADPKSQHLKSFIMNRSKKPGGWGPFARPPQVLLLSDRLALKWKQCLHKLQVLTPSPIFIRGAKLTV